MIHLIIFMPHGNEQMYEL